VDLSELTDDDRANALDDLYYEIQQLCISIQLLHERVGHSDAARNAFLESALVHFRVVLDFFEPRKRKDDDVLCSDYGFEPRDVELDAEVRKRLNKRLMHLSYLRARQRSAEDKAWALPAEARPLVSRSIEFIAFLGSEDVRLGDKSRSDWQRLREVLDGLIS